jgi:hypothetical protein
MRPQALGFFFAGTLFPSVLFPAGRTQQSATNPDVVQAAADPIIGFWKLNIEKSINPIAESELITITRQEEQFKIVVQAMQSNKYNPHYEVVTDMKGSTSKLVQADGRPMSDEWRVTRNQPNAFVVESLGPLGGKKEYAVSADGNRAESSASLGVPNYGTISAR